MTTPAGLVLAEVLAAVPPPAQAISLDAAGAAKILSSRPCLLYGWSAQDTGAPADTSQAYGSVAAPGAGATIATLTPGAGTWRVTVATHMIGALAAGDANNMELSAPGFGPAVLISDNSSPSIPFENGPYTITLAAGQALTVTAIAAATAGTTYAAQIIAEPASLSAFELYDGQSAAGQLVTAQYLPPGGSNEVDYGAPGILCRRGLFAGNISPGIMVVTHIVEL